MRQFRGVNFCGRNTSSISSLMRSSVPFSPFVQLTISVSGRSKGLMRSNSARQYCEGITLDHNLRAPSSVIKPHRSFA